MAHQQEFFLPFSSWQILSCCLSRVAKRSTPKLHGPLLFTPEPHGPLYFRSLWPSPFPLRTSWSSYSLQNCVVLFIHSRTAWSSLFPSELRGPLHSPSEPHGPLSMAATTRFKSQHRSSSAAPFPTPPTISYTCQHSRVLPALLGCHSKSEQVWPHGMEPIISKLSRRPCNQGELLPSYIQGGIHSHPPGSKHGHRYLTYL